MAPPQPAPHFSATNYLAWGAEQPGRHEYFHGETFAMGGASRRHVTVSGNVFAALDRVLENTRAAPTWPT
ncbi:MAG: Uma2 family endonuclease [Zoogloeaceae bacterium]|nr:Uma2 family endonuclease [Zoogloeaceae bacterium]